MNGVVGWHEECKAGDAAPPVDAYGLHGGATARWPRLLGLTTRLLSQLRCPALQPSSAAQLCSPALQPSSAAQLPHGCGMY